eukprot:4876253-Pleurochrysis_carterae.AAC.1
MKIPLVARPKRQNAPARSLALSFPPLQAQLKRHFTERARERDFFPGAPRPRLKTRAGTLTPCPHRRTALLCLAP